MTDQELYAAYLERKRAFIESRGWTMKPEDLFNTIQEDYKEFQVFCNEMAIRKLDNHFESTIQFDGSKSWIETNPD